jgi:hypothetical protein
MPLHPVVQERHDLPRFVSGGAEDPRREPFPDRVPGGVDGLGGVIRLLAGHAFGPGHHAVGILDLEEEDPALVHPARGDREALDERELDLSERDPFQTDGRHRRPSIVGSVPALPASR